MQRNIKQILLKYDCADRKSVEENALMYRERVKTLVRCVLLATFLLFLLLFYIPLYFQASLNKKSVDVTVDGWGFNISRSISLYVAPYNDTALIGDSQLCSEPLLLLIIVTSSVNNSQERMAIRETWGNFSSHFYKLAFLLGITENITLQENIEEESNLHGDIIQENFIDSYNNLTLKSVMLLKYVSQHCDKVEYILKSDDDMFVHVENLLALVRQFSEKKVKDVLVGELICNAKPILDTNNKWYSPRYMYQGKVYPHYLSGTGYLMDRKVAMQLYEAALVTPFFHLEDIYITGICARKAKIKPRYHSGFSLQTRPLDPCLYIRNPSLITSHRVTLSNMKQLWVGLHNHSLCTASPSSKLKTKLTVIKKNRCS